MNFRFGALLCMSSLSACASNATETSAKDPTYANETSPSPGDTELTPASLDNSRSTTTKEGSTELRAPTPAPVAASTPASAPGATPPASPSPAAKPDNTQVNKRDTASTALTPMDQKENRTDLNLTQDIRRALMADGSLSFTAKNVKIIAQNGKVTLRGPVNTAQERATIEAAARKVAGATRVDNQLEVKK